MGIFTVDEGVVMTYYMGVYKYVPESVSGEYPHSLYEVFVSSRRPTREMYGDMYRYVIGPFKSRAAIKAYEKIYGGLIERRRGYRGNPSKAKYCRKRLVGPKLFHPKSFRVVELSRKKGVKGIIGCPKKHFHRGKCAVGTRLQSMLYPVGHGKCPRPGLELNPYLKNTHLKGKGKEAQIRYILSMYKKLGWFDRDLKNLAITLWDMSDKVVYGMYRNAERKMKELRKIKSNPGERYHSRKFMEYLKGLEKWKVGSPGYIRDLAKAYEHLESANESAKQGIG
jgi:hypothetical protein